ncbi:sodium:proton antiporter [Methanosarcina sp. MTP4]|uniref:cation:proton antiporter n=1 Tax=Methanosarcina sp. MTP4 TaxID=1434100 RepID=UPI000AB68DCE|nr:sodium:proton antiporter [Methanosarcina sp. MTP4]
MTQKRDEVKVTGVTECMRISMTSEATSFVIAFATLLFVFSLVSRKISGTVVTAPMIFVAAGLLLSPEGLDLVELSAGSSFVLLVAEVALVLTLFADASRIELRALGQKGGLQNRLLFLGLPLVIFTGTASAAVIFTDLTLPEAALLGAILAPTDAGLGQTIVNNPKLPIRARQGLNIESGLNDGGAIPFFIFFLVLASGEELNQPIGTLLSLALEQIGFGAFVGIALGLLGGWLSGRASRAGWTSELYHRIEFLALAITSWLVADGIGGSGFVAAFLAGMASGAMGRRVEEEEIIFTEAEGSILSLAVFFIFGVVTATRLSAIGFSEIVYAVLSLTAIRMVPVAISLIGTKLHRETVLFLGWFGPRGLASVVLLLIAIEEAEGIQGLETISLVVTTTVLLSVFAHGISANPASEWYSRRVAALPEDAPELGEVKELPARPEFNAPENPQGNSREKTQ